ncbi:MAG TPA: arsenate reductase ArsC [Bacteroidota bacterium]|jgi:arsenate reductase|nr:arsenate reductase ArsC [Bacteroidota bacterium]
MQKKRVLFLCTGNSARSQMAEGLLRSFAGKEYEVFSAGTHPIPVRVEAVGVMGEIGIDISDHFSKSVDRFIHEPFDYVVTVCDSAKESCPVFHGARGTLHWSIKDPVGVGGTEAFRNARNELERRIRAFLAGTPEGIKDSTS